MEQNADLDTPIQYGAISYRSSPKDPANTIIVDGVNIEIGSNLHKALTQFRHPLLPCWFWIDQICIDQDNNVELLSQIALMSDIFQKAQTVLIWLGETANGSEVAMEILPLLVRHIQFAQDRRLIAESSSLISRYAESVRVWFSKYMIFLPYWVVSQSARNPSTLEQPEEQLSLPILDKQGALATALGKLLERDYFDRVWTLQEAALGRKVEVWCGNKTFPFLVLERLQRGCEEDRYGFWGNILGSMSYSIRRANPDHPDAALNAHLRIIRTLQSDAVATSSATALNSIRQLGCKDHRDRIYSILHFFEPGLRDTIIGLGDVDIARLFQSVATEELRQGSLDYLGAAGTSQHRMTYKNTLQDSSRPYLSLPTWVADWTYAVRSHGFWTHNRICTQSRGEALYNAGGRQVSNTDSLAAQGNVLKLDAIFVDQLQALIDPFHTPRRPEGASDERNFVKDSLPYYQAHVQKVMQTGQDCNDRYGSEIDTILAGRRTMIADLMPFATGVNATGILVRASEPAITTAFEALQWAATNIPPSFDFWQSMFNGSLSKEEIAEGSRKFQQQKPEADQKLPLALKCIDFIAEASKTRRFFTSLKYHYMGLAPDVSEPGDHIVVVRGHCASFVIRAVHDGNYQLVGECYVDRLMDGEALDNPEFEEKPITLV